MSPLEPITVQCPSCWEEIEVTVDTSAASQTYVEDCQVCCRPMVIRVEIKAGEIVSVNADIGDS